SAPAAAKATSICFGASFCFHESLPASSVFCLQRDTLRVVEGESPREAFHVGQVSARLLGSKVDRVDARALCYRRMPLGMEAGRKHGHHPHISKVLQRFMSLRIKQAEAQMHRL